MLKQVGTCKLSATCLITVVGVVGCFTRLLHHGAAPSLSTTYHQPRRLSKREVLERRAMKACPQVSSRASHG
ncbi:hypothetical protein F5B17DRAFT_390162 [Nemania serpens]|nr:hypothetical protein F5B17DRAFT_390162 [Nemania serpens]